MTNVCQTYKWQERGLRSECQQLCRENGNEKEEYNWSSKGESSQFSCSAHVQIHSFLLLNLPGDRHATPRHGGLLVTDK
jgi:hypothetical protein